MIDSKRMQAVQSPVIPHVAALIRDNPGTISLGQGVVHYPPPPQAMQALAHFGGAIAEHHYQAARGLPELSEGLRQKLARENQIEVGDDQVLMVTAGSNMGFYHALLAVADPGDEIVVMSPFYFNHEMAVAMANCRAVLVATDAAYQLDLDAIEAAITARTRAIVTISPNNPTGAVYRPTAGSNMGFYHALLAVADPGDEIVVMSPFYFNHEMAVAMANCRSVLVATDDAYQLDLGAIEAAITARTRAIVTISPNNPTGAVYRPEDLAAVNRLCRERGLYHFADEAYEYFTYGAARHFSPGSLPHSAEHTISLFSFSKAYGLASWRVGYLVAPRHLLGALEKIQDTVLICPPVISQRAALGALAAGAAYCRSHLAGMDAVRRLCLERLGVLGERVQVPAAEGAFYLLARLKTDLDAMDVVARLVREHKVAVIPGNAFGLSADCYLRVAYGALRQEDMAEGMDRLVGGLEQILSA